jgi:hypothetical protein
LADTLNNTVGLSSPAETITFDEVILPNGTAVTTQYAGLGVTFSSLDYNSTNPGPFPNVDSTDLTNFDSSGNTIANPFEIFFNTPQMSAAFALVTNPGTSTITAKLGGVTVQSFSPSTTFNSTTDFYGFTNITFDEIDVFVNTSVPGARIDNLQIGTAASVPEPATMVLFLPVLAALAAVRRCVRRRPL